MKTNVPILILARGGSKRIKNKNIVDFCGKPLICHAIEKSLKITQDVFVSSDSEKILSISQASGAKIIKRPSHLATDKAKSVDCLKHFFEVTGFSNVCLLQATNPLIKKSHIKSGIESFLKENFDTIVSASKEKLYIWNENLEPVNFDIESRNRSQEHRYVFVENGGFYICNKKNIIQNGSIFAGSVGFEEIEKSCSVDIDDEFDLSLARLIYEGDIKK